MDGLPTFRLTFRLTYIPAYLHVISCSTYLAFFVIAVVIVIVHHQFKRNTYLSLLCDWIFLYLQNHFSSLLPNCAELKYVIFLYFCIFVLCTGM
jgi:hypothetical protein